MRFFDSALSFTLSAITVIGLLLCTHIQQITAMGVCRTQSTNGKGYNMRKSGSELCKSKYNHLRNVDMYIWPGNDKPGCDKVTVYPVSAVEQDAQILAGATPGCDHLKISILTAYIDNEICPLFENNKNFDTDEKRKGAFAKLRQIINARENLRQITRDLEDAVKTPNVASFLQNDGLAVKAGKKEVNGAFVALNSYLTSTQTDSMNVVKELDTEMKNVITQLKAGLSTKSVDLEGACSASVRQSSFL
ncbi:hypothetical protein BT96DRAFT_679867 [Gymnopus androsaceus JB14]|uniref:Uncharacterized protein n=1 Tax=Gymnopus androsaceus JB14 TaxID=1447944 RepID=A0A6A4HSW7_9AGAR|nr:hypothetical protein BT96DRAFT_679867 [Gymnopus androsaceus JB14]